MELVTTALNCTHPKEINKPIALLGPWCHLHSKKKEWSKINYDVLPYHWDDKEKAFNDFNYLQNLNKILLPILSRKLNQVHNQNYTDRQWNLLFGYWLTQFIAVVFDRYTSIINAKIINKNFETKIVLNNQENLVPNDSNEAGIYFHSNDLWNHNLYGFIIENCTDFKINYISDNELNFKINDNLESFNHNGIKQLIKKFVFKLSMNFGKNNNVFFSTPGLNLSKYINLNIRLKQFPSFLVFPKIPKYTYKENLRDWNLDDYQYKSEFESILIKLIPNFIPKIFLEGFENLDMFGDKIKLPKSPKIIFTTKDHFSNDLFKIWSMKKINTSTKLIIGQHGSGAHYRYNGAMSYEHLICDKYLLSGEHSHKKGEKYIKIGQLFNHLKKGGYNPKGKGVLITGCMPRYAYDFRSMAMSGQMLNYFNQQFTFYNALPKDIKKQFIIRLYHHDYKWYQKNRWKENFSNVQFDKNIKMEKIIYRSRLSIHTYAATTYNQTLAANIPTIIYWNTSLWELESESDYYFKLLEEVGIFHTSPISAATQVSKTWEDVEGWWQSKSVQVARKKFCNEYANIPKNLTHKVFTVIRKELENGKAKFNG